MRGNWAKRSCRLEPPHEDGRMGRQASMVEPVVAACPATVGFHDWLVQSNGALAVSTDRANQSAMRGWEDHQARLYLREFDRPHGLFVGGEQNLWAARYDILVLINSPLSPPDFSGRARALSPLAEQTRPAIANHASHRLPACNAIEDASPGRTGSISASRSVNFQQEFQTLVGG